MGLINPATGQFVPFPNAFVCSNEVWPSSELEIMSDATGEAAVIIGSGNAPNILPLISGLQTAVFADVFPGHAEIFKAKLAAASIQPHSWYSTLGSFKDRWADEGKYFDLLRTDRDKQHVTSNPKRMQLFIDKCSSIDVIDAKVDVLRRETVANLGYCGTVGWVHLSNAFPYCIGDSIDEITGLDTMLSSIENIPGIHGDTRVSYSRFFGIKSKKYDFFSSKLVVTVKQMNDLVIEDLFYPKNKTLWDEYRSNGTSS